MGTVYKFEYIRVKCIFKGFKYILGCDREARIHVTRSERYFNLIFKTYINDMIYILRLIFSSDSCTDRIIMQNVIYINRPCNKSTQLK